MADNAKYGVFQAGKQLKDFLDKSEVTSSKKKHMEGPHVVLSFDKAHILTEFVHTQSGPYTRSSTVVWAIFYLSHFHTILVYGREVSSLLLRETVGNIQPGRERPQMGFAPHHGDWF